jgi:hypothetical protein
MFTSQAVLAKLGSHKDGECGGFDHPLACTHTCLHPKVRRIMCGHFSEKPAGFIGERMLAPMWA